MKKWWASASDKDDDHQGQLQELHVLGSISFDQVTPDMFRAAFCDIEKRPSYFDDLKAVEWVRRGNNSSDDFSSSSSSCQAGDVWLAHRSTGGKAIISRSACIRADVDPEGVFHFVSASEAVRGPWFVPNVINTFSLSLERSDTGCQIHYSSAFLPTAKYRIGRMLIRKICLNKSFMMDYNKYLRQEILHRVYVEALRRTVAELQNDDSSSDKKSILAAAKEHSSHDSSGRRPSECTRRTRTSWSSGSSASSNSTCSSVR
jgi:hypothetical protein